VTKDDLIFVFLKISQFSISAFFLKFY